MPKFRIVQIKDTDLWDSIVQKSPQYSIFSNSVYLNSIGKKFALFFFYKGQQVRAAVSLLLSDDEKKSELDELCIYNSILFFENTEQKKINARYEQFEITEFIINELDSIYESLEIALSPEFGDMRPFLWYNYHSPRLGDKFTLDLRYTCYLDISELFRKNQYDNTTLFKNMDGKRQSDVRKAIESNMTVREIDDVEILIRFYYELLKSQGIEVPESKLTRMKRLIEKLITNNLAKYFVSVDEKNRITYATVFTFHHNKGCYLFGAGDGEITQRYDGTYCIWEALKRLSEYGIYKIDMEGVNSPDRAHFKLGFGGDLKPYYQIYKN
jgi:hypothetical protein